jgi:(R)-2-hydroxyacyl-CoA dehydratese activating ATPase
MPVAGLDVGSLTCKAVILEQDKVIARQLISSGENGQSQARTALEKALENCGISFESLDYILATGAARKEIPFAHKYKTTQSCLAKGAHYLHPATRLLIDVGAEHCILVKLNENGTMEDFLSNDHCAAGTGIFLETMAKLMQMDLSEFAARSLGAGTYAEVSSMCAIFAEQEVISHIHRKPPTPKNDLIAGIHASMVSRIAGSARRLAPFSSVLLTGGVARNAGFKKILEEMLDTRIHVPENPEMVSALGAALLALRESGRKTSS